ncbi:MAG: DUF5977 domain-containing protein [Chitinophagaceae bacterium]|nr:DUF5977 domain-containing protein [Chitinophagaceae bacterium]
MKILEFIKRTSLLLSGILFLSNLFSQSIYPPKIQSPNAGSLGVYGETQMNLFTGTPNISIPIYTLAYGNISMPITLRYNPASVKPAQQPGWVGSGWMLDCGGAITRQKHGKVDEWFVNNYDGQNPDAMAIKSYYPFPSSSALANSTFGSQLANLPNVWSSPAQLRTDFEVNTFAIQYSPLLGYTYLSLPAFDPEADEFSFNVLGYSGKFYYEGSQGWKVVCDQNVKVELNYLFTPTEVVNGVSEHVNNSSYNGCLTLSPSNSYQSRMFGSFTLTLPDGTKCIFGGKQPFTPPPGYFGSGDSPVAVEFSSTRGLATDENSQDLVFEINTWYLKKIIDISGNEFNFRYEKRYPTASKSYQVDTTSGVAYFVSGNKTFYGGAGYNRYVLSEIMQWPAYLTQISSPNEIVNFKISNASCHLYTTKQLKYANFSDDNVLNNATVLQGALLGSNCTPDPDVFINNIKWQKLDSITITDNPGSVGLYQNQPKVSNKYLFNYSNTSNQRLMLGSLSRIGKSGGAGAVYQFEYNSDFRTQSSDLNADGNYTDHWGYYNGIDLPLDFQSIHAARVPVPTVSTTELLKKIIYPTGGADLFTWESNDYSQIVSIDRQSLVNWSNGVLGDFTLTGFGGGNRISEIKGIASDGTTVLTHKRYIYKNGYSNGVNLNALTSSGVLNGAPVYSYYYSGLAGVEGVYSFSGSTRTLYTGSNYGYTGHGSPIGYKEVTELNLDGSYTKYHYTNYDVDLNGVSHFDINPLGTIGWNSQSGLVQNYFPMSTLENERGKLTGEFNYRNDNVLLQKTNITYRNDVSRFNNYINLIEKRNEFGVPITFMQGANIIIPADRVTLASARKVFTYSYYPIEKKVTTYDQQGANPIVVTENYTNYNSSNLLVSKTTVDSKGNTIATSYKYPTDYTSTPYTTMVAKNIISPVVQSTVTNNLSPISQITQNYSEPYTGVFAPQNIEVKVGSNAPYTREEVTLFDPQGKVLEIQKPNDVKEAYIWGVNSNIVLARVIGAGYNDAVALIDQLVVNRAGFSYSPVNDEIVRAELNKLRTGLPNALVTTYTYAIGIGITSETDPNGRTIFYDFDEYNRLSIIRDENKNVLKRICYNYANQPESCAIWGNLVSSQSFTKSNCSADYAGTTGVYTVPEGTYYSSLSQADANAMAAQDISLNGQTYVDNNPASGAVCIPRVKSVNTTTLPYTVTFTNTSTGAVFSFTASLSSTPTNIGQVPSGNYTIQFVPYYTQTAQATVNGTTQTGSTITFSNISINAPLTVTIAPYSGGPCSFTMNSGYTSPSSNITNNGSSVSFYLVFYSSSSIVQGTSYQVATINGSCRPSVTRTINTTAGGRNWTITIYPDGRVFWQMAYGSATLNPYTTISTSTLTYNL